MKLTFLGTAASEGIPAVFCNCDTCKRAKALGGKDIRTRSQILIDGDTLFDFPMDTYMHMLTHRLDLSAVCRVLITHAHSDHCYPQEFTQRGAPYAHSMTEPNVRVFCNSTVRDIFLTETAREMDGEIAKTIELRVLHPYDEVIDGDMRIIALPAVHTKGEECLVYYIERDGAGVLLLNDTGVIDGEVYARLAGMGVNVRLAAFDCTYGPVRHGAGRHMGLLDVADQLELMRAKGVVSEHTAAVVTHFSHNGKASYADMCAAAAPLGISVAYDGMTVDVHK